LDNIDVQTAHDRGITVVYTPAASTDAVADLAVGLMIAVIRGIAVGDAAVRQDRFAEARASCVGRELSELTLGIIGLGRIGRAVARRCRLGFGMNVLYNDVVEPGWLEFTATPVDKTSLMQSSDIISLHVPLTNQTRGMIDSHVLRDVRPGTVLINTSRGAVVDSGALAVALADGQLAGAGLDVVGPEPLPPDHPLLHAPNVVFTPHIGARTHGGLARMNAVVDDVIRVLKGESPVFPAEV
jgi:phosphoglycerate dehydrogenase-like enzyme